MFIYLLTSRSIYLFIYKPAVVSGVHKKMNISLWKAESISLDFGDHQADLLNCKDSIISNANVKEFWDGFEEVSSMLFFVCFTAFWNIAPQNYKLQTWLNRFLIFETSILLWLIKKRQILGNKRLGLIPWFYP